MKPADWPTPSQRETLGLIYHNPHMRFQDLADKLGVHWTSARERVQRLEVAGLVRRMYGHQRSFVVTKRGGHYVQTFSSSHSDSS